MNSITKLYEFFTVWRSYARYHGIVYSARIAYGIAFRGLPF